MKALDPVFGAVQGLARLLGARTRAGASPPGFALDRILVATDGSPRASRAVHWAAYLARRFESKMRIVTVLGPRARYRRIGRARTGLWADDQAVAETILKTARRAARRRGVKPTLRLLVGTAATEVLREAERWNATLVVVGSHGRGPVRRAFLGSVADAVKHRAPMSVLIARNAPPPRTVLVSHDGSALGRHASMAGMALAKALKANVRLLHVVPAPTLSRWARVSEAVRTLAGRILRDVRPGRPMAVDVQYSVEADHIVRAAEAANAGLVVMGSRGLGWLERHVVGSVSNLVSHQAPRSVFLFKEQAARPRLGAHDSGKEPGPRRKAPTKRAAGARGRRSRARGRPRRGRTPREPLRRTDPSR